MANNTKVVCKNVFKNKDEAAFKKMFTLKWIELINQFEKSKGQSTPARCYNNISSDSLFCLL